MVPNATSRQFPLLKLDEEKSQVDYVDDSTKAKQTTHPLGQFSLSDVSLPSQRIYLESSIG